MTLLGWSKKISMVGGELIGDLERCLLDVSRKWLGVEELGVWVALLPSLQVGVGDHVVCDAIKCEKFTRAIMLEGVTIFLQNRQQRWRESW